MDRAELYSLIRAQAIATGLDWWLIYGVIEQESDFDPDAESNCGALGLMQLMPSSFPGFPRAALLTPGTNLDLGAHYLQQCIGVWRRETADEAVKFGLASYNGGAGYVLKAQEQADLAGEPTNEWAKVAPFLASVEADGKRPDAAQIGEYVSRIWTRYAARRGTAIPTPSAVVA